MEIRSAEGFLTYFETVRERTLRVTRAIPPDQIEWTCRPGEFTFGDLARHIVAVERYVFAEAVLGKQSLYTGYGRELADGYDNVLAYMDRLHRESVDIFRSISNEDLLKKGRSVDGAAVTAWKLLRGMIEHEAHHRGQMYVYLGILGVPAPPLFGLNERGLLERSATV